jgi:hypothetical protein
MQDATGKNHLALMTLSIQAGPVEFWYHRQP